MRKEIANLIFPVFRKAIEIKEGLQVNPSAWDFGESQRKLIAMLQTAVPDPLRPDILGDQRAIDATVTQTRLGYLGIRYALACWLDETFISDTPWKELWNANKVETTLFGINDRATEFWKQAQRAQARPTRDSLEAYYLCVMLGFRGEWFDNPAEVAAWRDRVETQITQNEDREYTPPPSLAITPNVYPLKGMPRMQKWAMFTTMLALAFIPLLICLVGYQK